MMEKGSSYGELTSDNSGGVAPTLNAVDCSRVMMLWRPAFFSVLDSWAPEVKTAILARLDTLPKRERISGMTGTSLRHRTDWLASQCIKSVAMSLRVNVRKQERKMTGKKMLWKAVKRANIIRDVMNIPKVRKKEKEAAEEDSSGVIKT